jgi:manganese/iron transport system permease protein/iron/zinc/copper transport system permease protein
VKAPADQVERAIDYLQAQGMLATDNGSLVVTERGAHEARRILRAHRLWEAYLARVGTPAGELHDTAHRLEHLHDEETVDYIDDILGHPIKDPHGSPIPEDFVHLVPGQEIKASLLREGMHAIVVKVGARARQMGMRVAMKLAAGPRRNDGRTWTFVVPGDIELSLDHGAADDLLVVLDEEELTSARRASEG